MDSDKFSYDPAPKLLVPKPRFFKFALFTDEIEDSNEREYVFINLDKIQSFRFTIAVSSISEFTAKAIVIVTDTGDHYTVLDNDEADPLSPTFNLFEYFEVRS